MKHGYVLWGINIDQKKMELSKYDESYLPDIRGY